MERDTDIESATASLLSHPNTPITPSSVDNIVLSTKTKKERGCCKIRGKFTPSPSKLIITCLAIWGFLNLCFQASKILQRYQQPTTDLTLDRAGDECDCGSSIDEAKSMGCKFDALASAWLPPQCRDDELTEEFTRAGPGPDGSWPYYADPNGTIPISTADIEHMGGTTKFWYSTKEWHVVHCNFYWRKIFRMKETGRLMERRYDTIDHIRHCHGVVMEDRPMDSIAVYAGVSLNSAA